LEIGAGLRQVVFLRYSCIEGAFFSTFSFSDTFSFSGEPSNKGILQKSSLLLASVRLKWPENNELACENKKLVTVISVILNRRNFHNLAYRISAKI